MATSIRATASSDDPRRLRELIGRARTLSLDHRIPSVFVGLAAPEGDLVFPDLIEFVQSSLRIEDHVFRMTRERAILMLSDATREHAETVIERLLADFREQFPTAAEPFVSVGFFLVEPGTEELSARDVLPAVFAHSAVTAH